jgi:hypothetical protein
MSKDTLEVFNKLKNYKLFNYKNQFCKTFYKYKIFLDGIQQHFCLFWFSSYVASHHLAMAPQSGAKQNKLVEGTS